MKANRWLFLFRFITLIFLFLICTIDVRGEPDTVSNDCDIDSYIAYLHTKWTSTNWPQETSSRCIGHILLQWAYQLRGALDGKTTIKKNKYLDRESSNLEAKCNPSLETRINRSSLDALTDVFSLLLKLTNVLQEDVDWCSLTATRCHETYYNQTLVLVRTMNCLVRRQNRLNLNNQINNETESLCDK